VQIGQIRIADEFTHPTGATASGTVVFHWTRGTDEAGTLRYVVAGSVLNSVVRDQYDPPAYPAGYRRSASDLLVFLRATLSSFSYRLAVRSDCADGSKSDTTTTGSEVTDRRAVLSLVERLEVDVLRSRGSTPVTPDSRDRRADGGIVHNSTLWRGLGTVTLTTTGHACPENVSQPRHETLRADEVVPREVLIEWSPERTIPVRVLEDGSLEVHGGWQSSAADGYAARLTVDLRLRGPLRGLGAFCTWPTDHDLAGARTVAQAQAVVARAGLVTRFGGDRANAEVRKDHYFITYGPPSWPCSTPSGTQLFRSLGHL